MIGKNVKLVNVGSLRVTCLQLQGTLNPMLHNALEHFYNTSNYFGAYTASRVFSTPFTVLLKRRKTHEKMLFGIWLSGPFNHQLFLTYLTTRVEGDIVRGQLTFSVESPELLTRGAMGGGILSEGEGREGRIAGKEEGGEICDGRGGAGV